MRGEFELKNAERLTLGGESFVTYDPRGAMRHVVYKRLKRIWPEEAGVFAKTYIVKYVHGDDPYDSVVPGRIEFKSQQDRDEFLIALRERMV